MKDRVSGMIYGFPQKSKDDSLMEPCEMSAGWTLHIKDQSWVEDTVHQVDFIIQTLGLTGDERILDMACGFGRHSLELARRGFSVVGVDITQAYIDDARSEARKALLNVEFLQSDIRDIGFREEFDVVSTLRTGRSGTLKPTRIISSYSTRLHEA